MMKKFAFLLVALISIAGCKTTPIPTNKAVDVPSERVFNKTLLNDGADRGTVIVKRDSGHVGNACYSIVYMDGKELAYLDPGEKFEFYPQLGITFSGHNLKVCVADRQVSCRLQSDMGKSTPSGSDMTRA